MQEVQAVRPAQGVDHIHEEETCRRCSKVSTKQIYLNFQALDKLGIKEINVQRKAPASFIDSQK